MFRGRLDEYDLPPYLDRDCLQKIIQRMDKVEIRTENILEFMETVDENSLTKFSLSDVPSFLDQEMFERLLDGIVRSGAHGARFCIRQFLTNQVIPDRFEAILVREVNLEDQLSKRDRSFAYRFIVGRVKKGG
jgi:S-adenosylmethionine-diacylglycerol 3-amino-3-carboxypropyl transferase